MEVIENLNWWRVNKVFNKCEEDTIQAFISENVILNFAQGKRDEATKRTFISKDSKFIHTFQDLDVQLREYFKDFIHNSDRIRVELCADAQGMWIDPHYDISEKSFTMQVYLGHDNTDGTIFHFDEGYDHEVPWVGAARVIPV